MPFRRQHPLALTVILLGGGGGSLAGLAIAYFFTSDSSHSDAPHSPSLSSPIDLSQFKSSDVPLTQQQREILRCLWLMAAIAPHPTEASDPAAAKRSLPTTWDWCIEQIQQSAIAREDLSNILTAMGFSKQTIQTAWRIARALQTEAVSSD
jgi:hypothetical protein